VEDTLAEPSVAADADSRLIVLIHLTEKARLRAPLARREVIKSDTAKHARFHILDSRSVQNAYHVHPPVYGIIGMENGNRLW
jgi:hypothetical protein